MELKTTIGVAVYNIEEKFLRECLDSVTAALNDETEVIIVDDCSTNGADSVIREYSDKYSGIRCIRMPQNSGISAVRNTIIENARGRMVYFVDGDDLVSDYFSEIAAMAAESECDVVVFDRISFTGKKQKETPPGKPYTKVLSAEDMKEFALHCLTNKPIDRKALGLGPYATDVSVCSVAYNLNFLKENKLYFIVGQKKAQDLLFNIPVYYNAKKAVYIQHPINYYRKNPASICNRYSADFPAIMKKYMDYCSGYLEKLYNNDETVKGYLMTYKVLVVSLENMELNIFHKDNPNSYRERKKYFNSFRDEEPFKTFFDTFDFDSYEWFERRLIMKLAARRQFFTLNLLFRHPFLLVICGGVRCRLIKLMHAVKIR